MHRIVFLRAKAATAFSAS